MIQSSPKRLSERIEDRKVVEQVADAAYDALPETEHDRQRGIWLNEETFRDEFCPPIRQKFSDIGVPLSDFEYVYICERMIYRQGMQCLLPAHGYDYHLYIRHVIRNDVRSFLERVVDECDEDMAQNCFGEAFGPMEEVGTG